MKSILIVEASEQDRRLIERILCGCVIVSSSNGADALALARQQRPDLALSAVAMPGMDGFALCREWRSDERLRGIPFILYSTATAGPQDEQQALDAGADRFVLLPQGTQALDGIIQDMLIRRLEKRIAELEAANQQLVQDTHRMRETKALLRQSEERWRLIIETEP